MIFGFRKYSPHQVITHSTLAGALSKRPAFAHGISYPGYLGTKFRTIAVCVLNLHCCTPAGSTGIGDLPMSGHLYTFVLNLRYRRTQVITY